MNILEIADWLDGVHHKARKGHWPAYYDVGKGLSVGNVSMERVCVNCLRGGHRKPTRVPGWLMPLAPVPVPR